MSRKGKPTSRLARTSGHIYKGSQLDWLLGVIERHRPSQIVEEERKCRDCGFPYPCDTASLGYLLLEDRNLHGQLNDRLHAYEIAREEARKAQWDALSDEDKALVQRVAGAVDA